MLLKAQNGTKCLRRDITPTILLKPGFHMSGKSQTVWDFTVSTVPDFAD